MPSLKSKDDENEKIIFAFYDFESRQDTVINDGKSSKFHVPKFMCTLTCLLHVYEE